MLDDSDEDGTLLTPKKEPGTDGDGAGCSAPAPPLTGDDSDSDDSDGGDYTRFYRHFSM